MNPTTADRLACQERTRREILHKSDLIPALPDVVIRMLAILNRQDTEPKHLEDLMRHDQVLVGRLLAMVNSPFYGLGRSISTVREAVVVLGFRGVRSLVLAVGTARLMHRDYGAYGYEAKGLWLHAASVATGARSISRALGVATDVAEETFVGGLLHDIGKLVLAPYLAEQGCIVGNGRPVVEVERELIGIDHTEAGALVTAKWGLDPEIQEIVKRHHDAPAPQAESARVSIVRLADAIAHQRGFGLAPGRARAVSVFRGDLDVLGLTESAWAVLRDEVAARMAEGADALECLGV